MGDRLSRWEESRAEMHGPKLHLYAMQKNFMHTVLSEESQLLKRIYCSITFHKVLKSQTEL